MNNTHRAMPGPQGLSAQELEYYQQQTNDSAILGQYPVQPLPTQTLGQPTTYSSPYYLQWHETEHQNPPQSGPRFSPTSEVDLGPSHNNINNQGVQSWGGYDHTAPIGPMAPAVSQLNEIGTAPQGHFEELGTIMRDAIIYYELFWNAAMPPTPEDLSWFQVQLQKAMSLVESMQTPEAEPDGKKKFRCILCQGGKEYGTPGTLKRHIASEHHPNTEYFCPICHNQHQRWSTNRRDKHHEHMRHQHQHRALTRTEMAKVTVPLPPPPYCVYEECGKAIKTWDQFFECLYKHCSISGAGRKQHNDRKGGDGGGDPGSSSGSRHFPSPGDNGHGSNSDSFQSHRLDNCGFGNPSAGYGGGSYSYVNYGLGHLDVPDDPAESPTSSSENTAPVALNSWSCNDQEHHGDINPRKHVQLETTSMNALAETDDAHLNSTKSPFSRGLERITGLDKDQEKFPLPRPEEECQTTCESCGHTSENCKKCERLAGALIQCHRCADDPSQRASTGSLGDACPRTSPVDALNSEVSGLRDGVNSKWLSLIARELTNTGQSGFNPPDKVADSGYRCTEVMRRLLSFRFECSVRKLHDDSSKLTAEEESASEEAVATGNDKTIPREFQRLRYFERYLHATQTQGSFLTCVRETLIVSEPPNFIISSLQEIVYQRVSLESEKCPDIPSYHLFYLMQEKDHKSSEANLEVARRESPKRRAHLRVRIRAIAGILALRAAVSKAPPSVDNNDTSDGWELGIPLPQLATEEDVVRVLTWLVQSLVVFLRMPPNPKIYVLLANSWRNVPRLI
ncbi:hypothetical protein BDV12DRAFT_81520 [Aspergillus spectabilis]